MRRLAFLVTFLFLAGCWSREVKLEFSGETMGTVYNVVAVDRTGVLDPNKIQAAIDASLQSVNEAMSNWDPQSEVSRFNAGGTEAVEISTALAEVMHMANDVHIASEGRFDVTLGPLIEIWGFGRPTMDSKVPSDSEIESALELVGQSRLLRLTENPITLQKINAQTSVYLAAIAKGYGIDQIAVALRDLGLSDFLVEIGGDLVTSGLNDRNAAWRIGIERPDPSSQRVEDVIPVRNMGMATSGDYRNYFEQNGVRYSHVIDAVTGRPITHKTASVTVLAESAMVADAWATALLALGLERGMPIAEKNSVAVFFIERDTSILEGGFSTVASSRFKEIVASTEE